jgi:hypothetical protein
MKSPSASRKYSLCTSSVLAIGAALLILAPGKLHATSITYYLIGVDTSAGTLTGTVAIDPSTDEITSADITFNDPSAGSPVFTSVGSPGAYQELGQAFISGSSNSPLNYGGQMALYYDTADIGTGNLTICDGPCGTGSDKSYAQVYVSNSNGGPFDVTGGTLDLASVALATPESSTLLLLGIGLLGLGLLVRRQLAA